MLRLIACCLVLSMLMFGLSMQGAQAEEGDIDSKIDTVATSIQTLTSSDVELDGKRVAFSGECVGEAINSDVEGYKWINVSDGGAAVSVYMSDEDAAQITNFGGYAVKGTNITVYGVYHTQCDEDGHAGALDVHADAIEIRSAGGANPQGFGSPTRWMMAGCLVGLSVILTIIYYVHKRRGA